MAKANLDQTATVTPLDKRSSGVHSIERAFNILETLALSDKSMGLSQLAAESGLPLPTIHRLVRTLVGLGYVRQEPNRQYALGPRMLVLADSAPHMLHSLAEPHLSRLVDELGETANLATLDGDQIVYMAQVPSRHSMRMFTEVGRRVLPHCTAVGKAVMATMPDSDVRAMLGRTGMPRHTEHTVTEPDQLIEQLNFSRRHGYAIDDGEQELGVRCVAVAVPGARIRMALSVSGPTGRMTPDAVDRAVPLLITTSQALGAELAG